MHSHCMYMSWLLSSQRTRFNICECENTGYFNKMSGHIPAMFVATEPDILSQNMIIPQHLTK